VSGVTVRPMSRWKLLALGALLGACPSGSGRGPEHGAPVVPSAEAREGASEAEGPVARAKRLAQELIILDGHVDVPWRLSRSRADDGSLAEDVSEQTEAGDFDYVRARRGGLDAPFMSIFVSAEHEHNGAKRLADELIDMVETIAAGAPEKFALARTPDDVRENFRAGKISLPMGMENGAPIEGDLANVAYFAERGIRYITLTHGKDNHIADSSYDERRTHGGLSAFGKEVVAEMNRVGIMVDVSHLSDAAAEQAIALSAVPVIASHSSCRHFTPGWERNMSDALIRQLAEKGGVIQINFGSMFLAGKRGPGQATVEQLADHIDHVVALVGIDHVGLGSDFDGVGESLPTGLEDVSKYPNLIRVLLERGYTEQQIEQIVSGNVLRVWQAALDHAASLSSPRRP
jgi:membrane dipeptidase